MANLELETTPEVPEEQEEYTENAELDEAAESDEDDTTDISGSFSEEDTDGDSGGDDEDVIDRKKKKKKKILIIVSIIVGIIILLIVTFSVVKAVKLRAAAKNMYTDAAVERRTISNSITGSSTIEPNDAYTVTTIKSGDITADYFKEGDTVKKGDKLYQFDDEDARNTLSSAQNALTKAEQAYVDAVKQRAQTVSSNNISTKNAQNSVTKALNTLSDAQRTYGDQYPTSDISGKVKSVSVSEGDTVNNGMEIASIYDDSSMKIRLPFNDYDASNVYTGADAQVTVTGSGDTIYGTVTEKSSQTTATDKHTMVVYVTIEVVNPGALTESDTGSAVVNGVACADTANFEYASSQKITAKTSGTIKTLNVSAGDSVYSGQQIAYIKSDTANSTLSNAQITYDDAVLALQKQVLANDTFSQDSNIKNAQLALDDARLNINKAQDAVDDYLIEAPIDGTVVKKTAKSGDTIDTSNNTEPLCVIYDLSCVKISIDVDETEIALVKTGQTAKITADAVDGEFKGIVTKVPVDGVNENGVATYTIEIQIDNYGDLLPGMNVDAEITVEQADNVIAIPVNSVNRGDIVFVKDDGQKRDNDVTDIIKNKAEGNDAKSDDNKAAKETEAPEKKHEDKSSEGEIPVVSSPSDGSKPEGTSSPDAKQGGVDESSVPGNIEVPEGYRAIKVETGINDTEYIEIKSGLSENDTVRTLNTKSSSEDAALSPEEQMMKNMQSMRGGMSGGMSGMSGGMGGGMSGSRSGGAPGGGAPGGR
ncbi:MAG: efflux RND transporter periplasmic adaptor subunit [Hominilimicola sp.]